MKKFFATILALVMVLAMSTTTFAAGPEAGAQSGVKTSQTIDVNGKYMDSTYTEDVISVNIEWGALDFIYATSDTGKWNPADHTYSNNSSSAGWVGTKTSDIKVTNHSNVAVTADFGFVAAENHSTVTGSFSQDSLSLTEGVVNQPTTAPTATTTFTIGGTLASTATSSVKIGTITVTISKT